LSTNGVKQPSSPNAGTQFLLKNATVLDYFPIEPGAAADPKVELVDLRIQGDRITARGKDLTPEAGEQVIDLQGVSVMPGNINAHGHMYSSLAAGMPQLA